MSRKRETIENKKAKTRKYKEEIENLKLDLEEAKEKNLRTHADFQNIKKRLEKEKIKSIEMANERFSLDLLDVLDTLYLAEAAITEENEKEGITNTIKKLEGIFEKYNITETLYDIFNPDFHQAIQTVESDKESGEIVEVLRKGYKIHNKILRPAMVSVSK